MVFVRKSEVQAPPCQNELIKQIENQGKGKTEGKEEQQKKSWNSECFEWTRSDLHIKRNMEIDTFLHMQIDEPKHGLSTRSVMVVLLLLLQLLQTHTNFNTPMIGDRPNARSLSESNAISNEGCEHQTTAPMIT